MFSFIGCIIDTIYTSLIIKKGKWKMSGYYKNIPLCPVYGFGGLLIYQLFTTFYDLPWYITIIITATAITLLEYITGVFCVKVLKERLWDYRGMVGNINGHITLSIIINWFLLVTILYFFAHPYINQIEKIRLNLCEIFGPYDILFIVPALGLIFMYTIKTRDKRLRKLIHK